MNRFLHKLLSVRERKARGRSFPHTRFRPRLEVLENRQCLSVTASYSLGTLTIMGDEFANDVAVVQNDTSNTLEVYSNNALIGTFNSYQVKEMNVQLLGGADYFWWGLPDGSNFSNSKEAKIYLGAGADEAWLDFRGDQATLLGSLTANVYGAGGADEVIAHFGHKHGGILQLALHMQGGNDTAHAMMWGDISGGADVSFLLSGQTGQDALGVWCTYDNKSGQYDDIKITADATFAIQLHGGEGADSLGPLFSGEVDGKLSLIVDGSYGDDNIDADVYLQASSSGSFFGRVLGGYDDDTLAFHVWDDSGGFADIDARLNGGAGFDTGVASPNVAKINCEA